MPRNGNESAAPMETPSSDNAARASGIRPSPQALSAGGRIASATATLKPFRRVAIAAAKPPGPPPTIKIPVFTTPTTPFDLSRISRLIFDAFFRLQSLHVVFRARPDALVGGST